MMMSACEYIVVGVKGSKSVFNSDIELASSDNLTDQEIVAVADKAATVIELEIRKALSSIGGRPSPQEIQEVVSLTMLKQAEIVAKRAINIYSAQGDRAELCVPNYVTFNSKAGNRLHPTEKPVQLLRYLTELFSNPGDIVLDPFSGSASMGEAAVLTGRRAILVERDEEFFEKGSIRIARILHEIENRLAL
jgi:DNA modification methylase